MTASEIILSITGIFIAWQAWETRKLAKLTRIKDQPLLEVEFQNQGTEVVLKNLGQSPAYSPLINSLQITNNEYFDFDPLHSSRLSILPGESRKVWMHHRIVTERSIGGFLESIPALKNSILNRRINTPFKMDLQYFDKDGVKLTRSLYVKIGGNEVSGGRYIYTSTSSG
ncbi:MAG: hypothetical protein NT077_01300 [Candidatus Taylorbacteria bacterium]|nr:hypothetical protein [Candidatus Taylorbacteria bacterium]